MTADEPVEGRVVMRVVENSAGGCDYWLWCPACDDAVRIDSGWEWDGNMEAPTFAPSILTRGGSNGRRCHSFVRAGRWEFLSDCTHDLAGQTVPMVQLPQWLLDSFLEFNAMTSPSVPVESREQPGEEERWPEFEFIDSDGAWRPEPRPSVDETARLRGSNVYLRAELQQADATIRELRAEAAREFESGNEWCQRALASEAALETTLAERDRARDLAAHLEEQLAEITEVAYDQGLEWRETGLEVQAILTRWGRPGPEDFDEAEPSEETT